MLSGKKIDKSKHDAIAEKLYLPKAMNIIKPMFGKCDDKKTCLPKNSNLIIMAWKTSDFLVLHEP